MGNYKFVYTTDRLSKEARMASYPRPGKTLLSQGLLEDIEDFNELAEFNIETKTKAIAITLRDLVGSITQRATEGKYFLLANLNYPEWDSDGNVVENSNNLEEKAITIGYYPKNRSSTEGNYPDMDVLNKLLTPDLIKQIISSNDIAIACLTDAINHWDYNFLKASSMFGGSFRAIGLQEEDGDVIDQNYYEGEYDSGYIASDEEFQYCHIMNDENQDLQKFSFVFNDPEALK